MPEASSLKQLNTGKIYHFKVVLLGESASGKSSIALSFVRENFIDALDITVGAEYLTKTMKVGNNVLIRYEIWDTAGQERYHSIAPMYYRDSQIALIIYDITNRASYDKAKEWIKELRHYPNILTTLIGNKLDLDTKRTVTHDEAETYANENDLFYMEVSAKLPQTINNLFQKISSRLPSISPDANLSLSKNRTDSIRLGANKSKYSNERKKKCCN